MIERRNREDRQTAFQAEYEALLAKYNARAYTWVRGAISFPAYEGDAVVTVVVQDESPFEFELAV